MFTLHLLVARFIPVCQPSDLAIHWWEVIHLVAVMIYRASSIQVQFHPPVLRNVNWGMEAAKGSTCKSSRIHGRRWFWCRCCSNSSHFCTSSSFVFCNLHFFFCSICSINWAECHLAVLDLHGQKWRSSFTLTHTVDKWVFYGRLFLGKCKVQREQQA